MMTERKRDRERGQEKREMKGKEKERR